MLGQDKACRGQTSPPLVHGLGLHLWHEIQHFRAHDFDYVTLPEFQVRGMMHQEEQNVLLWLFGKLGWFAELALARLFGFFGPGVESPQVIVWAGYYVGGFVVFFIWFVLADQKVIVYMFLYGEHGIKETLDFGFTMIELVFGDAFGMEANFIDHAARGMLEVGIVFEKVGMPEDVRRHKGVLEQVVHIHQKGVAGIGVDDHLVNFAQSEVVLHFLPVVGFAVRPVTETSGQAVRGKFVHDRRWHQLKVRGKRIKSEIASLFPGMINAISQSFDIANCHWKLLSSVRGWDRAARRTSSARDRPLFCQRW